MGEGPEDPGSALTGMLGMLEAFAPIMEMAKGLKTQMEAEGWSPSAAEDVARELMVGAMRVAMGGRR